MILCHRESSLGNINTLSKNKDIFIVPEGKEIVALRRSTANSKKVLLSRQMHRYKSQRRGDILPNLEQEGTVTKVSLHCKARNKNYNRMISLVLYSPNYHT